MNVKKLYSLEKRARNFNMENLRTPFLTPLDYILAIILELHSGG